MAAGLPVAATDVGDTKSIVAELNCPFVVSAGDEPALGAALGALLDDPARRRSLGDANRTKAHAEFSLDAMVSAYDRLFESRGSYR
jgi:glycosyltransferase involved in cell wall biosynthesis